MRRTAIGMAAVTLCVLTSAAGSQTATPARWPAAHSPADLIDSRTEARIDALLARMSLEEKIGQMIQADLNAVTPDDLRTYPLGSILAGGSSPPIGAPDRSPAAPWVATSRAFNAIAMEKR